MKSDILGDEIKVWGFENNFIVFDDASLGFGLKLSPLDVNCASDDERNQHALSAMQLLNGLPANTDLQIVCDIRAGNRAVIDGFRVVERFLSAPLTL